MIEERNDMQMDFDEDAQYTERKRILFFGLPWTFTKYNIKPSVITVDAGLFKIEENDCYMYKVQDVKLTATLLERMFGLGTIHCCSGDKTSPEFDILHIKDVRRVKDMLSDMVEEERAKKRIGTRELLDNGEYDESEEIHDEQSDGN